MSNIRTSFTYDPVRQGYDTNSWRTISGAPAVTGTGRFVVDAGVGTTGSAVHYADFLKGDISFDVNIENLDADGDFRQFGVASLSSSNYIYFQISDGSLTCRTSDGINSTTSPSLVWNDLWNGVNTIFRIRWEAGTAKFFIAGTQVYSVTDASVPHGPMSLYLLDNSDVAMSFGDISVKGTNSFVMNPKTADSTPNIPATPSLLFASQTVTVTEALTMLLKNLSIPYTPGTMFDSVTITENLAFSIVTKDSVFDTVTITENISLVRI